MHNQKLFKKKKKVVPLENSDYSPEDFIWALYQKYKLNISNISAFKPTHC